MRNGVTGQFTRDLFITLSAHGPHEGCPKENFMPWAFLVLYCIVSDLISFFFLLFQDDLSSLPRPTRPCRGIELSVRNGQASLTRSVLASTILSDSSIVSIAYVLRRIMLMSFIQVTSYHRNTVFIGHLVSSVLPIVDFFSPIIKMKKVPKFAVSTLVPS